MARVSSEHPLGMAPGLYLTRLYLASITKPLDADNVEVIPNPRNSTLTIRSLNYTSHGEPGIYRGQHVQPYIKQSLAEVTPLPIQYNGGWPTRWSRFKNYLFNATGIFLEDGVYRLNGVGGVLTGDDLMAATSGDGDIVQLVPTADSILWQPDIPLNIRVTRYNETQSLAALLPQSQPATMDLLIAG